MSEYFALHPDAKDSTLDIIDDGTEIVTKKQEIVLVSNICSFIFQVSLDLSTLGEDDTIAIASFRNEQDTNGWLNLEVKTSKEAKDEDAARAAGIAEGYLTR